MCGCLFVWQCGLLVEHTVALVWMCSVFDECFVAEQCERRWYEHLLAQTPAVCGNGRCLRCLIERIGVCCVASCWWGLPAHGVLCDGFTQARSSTVVERLFLFVVEHRCLCVLVVLLFVAMDGMSTWLGGLLDHVIEMVLAVLKEFSWCFSNARATGWNGDTVWCV